MKNGLRPNFESFHGREMRFNSEGVRCNKYTIHSGLPRRPSSRRLVDDVQLSSYIQMKRTLRISSTHFVSFAKKVIRPTESAVRCVQEVCSRHAQTVDEEYWKRLGNFCRSKMLDIHLASSNRRVSLSNISLANIKIGAAVQSSLRLNMRLPKHPRKKTRDCSK